MSSPIMTPPPIAPPPKRQRSIAGPFVLIIMGTVFLLATMRVLSVGRLAHMFANYWPVLLILWGVIKIIEHMQAQREGTRSSGIGAGGVMLIVMIVVFGLIATQLEHVNWSGIRDNFNFDDGDFPMFGGDNFNYTDHLEANFPAGASLKVVDTRGAVSIHPSDDNKITIAVRKRLAADNQTDADKYNNETRPTITTMGGMVTVDAKTEAAGDHPVETDLDISIPRKASVTISSRRGDVNISGRDGNLDLSTQHADITVEDVTGSVKINQEKGAARVQQVTGDVRIQGRLNEVAVSDIKGAVQLDGEFQESVKLERIAKNVSFKSSRTDMEFSHIDGSLDLDSDELQANQINGPIRLTTRSKNIRLAEVTGDVRLQNDNGAIELGVRNLGNVQIDNRNGDIQLLVPEKANFRLDARTRDGEIQSDFPELKISNQDRESKASGSVGAGTAHIVVNNEHDGIEIRKAPIPGGPKEGVSGGVEGGVPGAKQSRSGKSLPAPKEKVEPTEN